MLLTYRVKTGHNYFVVKGRVAAEGQSDLTFLENELRIEVSPIRAILATYICEEVWPRDDRKTRRGYRHRP
jgi:hypothetical protein